MMNKNSIATAVASALSVVGFEAVAQDLAAANPISLQLEEVVVTATRRAADARDIPISITALSEEYLAAQGIESFEGVARNTPGVLLTGSNSFTRFVIRGIQTSSTSASNGEQRQVAVYYDDVPLTSFSVVTPNLRLYDIERVEVLRGPQGTSFGSGSLAGAVRVITNKASVDSFNGGVRVDLGSVKDGGTRQRYSGFLNTPVSDDFAVRAVGYYRDEDGFIDNIGTFGFDPVKDENSTEEHGFRASAKWLVNEQIDATLSYSMDRLEIGSLAASQNQNLDTFQRATFFPELVDVEMDIANLTLNWDLDWATLIWSANYANQYTSWDLDLDAIFGPVLPFGYGESLDTDMTINELRFISSDASKLQYTFGLYHFDMETSAVGARFTGPDALSVFGVDMSAITQIREPGDTIGSVIRDVETTESALFAEVTFELSSQLRILLGGRYTAYKFSQIDSPDNFNTDALQLAFTGGGTASMIPAPPNSTSTGNQNKSTFKASLQWTPDDSQMWYLTAAEGFRRAHPNISRDDLVAPDSPNFTPKLADADSLWSYELGYKSRMLEGQLAINAALYFIDWQDAQVSASRQSDAEPYLTNAGDIESMGIELDIRYLASASLELGGTLALNDSEVVSIDMNDSLASGLTLGSSLVAPETQASLYFQWQVAQLGAGAINLRGDMQYVDGYLNAPPNIPGVGVPNPFVMRTDSITNVAAQLGYETEKWGTYLYGENLSNDDGFAWINPDPFSSNNSVTLQPRTIGLRVNYQF